MQFSITSLQAVKPDLLSLMNIQKQWLWCIFLQIPFTKIRSLQQGVRIVQKILNKLKFNTKIGRYAAMLFMVIRFKERNLQRRTKAV